LLRNAFQSGGPDGLALVVGGGDDGVALTLEGAGELPLPGAHAAATAPTAVSPAARRNVLLATEVM
jgi:hypothetical protein